MNDLPSTTTRRWRPQFGLRLLFLAITAFAIGFPIWYRWPYREEMVQRDTTGAVVLKRITTWQRQWGGERLKHGPEAEIFGDSLLTSTTTYVRDRRHGPYTERVPKLREVDGQYADDMKDGVWTYRESPPVKPNRQPPLEPSTTIARWHRGRLDGEYETRSFYGRTESFLFANGRLKKMNGAAVESGLFDLLESGKIEGRAGAGLREPTQAEFVETPLKDVLMYFQDAHQIPMMIDSRALEKAGVPSDCPITSDLEGLDLCSALAILLAPLQLDCDYRYGLLWVTTIDDAKNWRDPTGIVEIEPAKGSPLAKVWDRSTSVEAVETPLHEVLFDMVSDLPIEIDASRIEPTTNSPARLVTANLNGIPFRHALGFVLYRVGCRCRLEGQKLIILPADTP